jgi:exopolysaccharide biosynthesis protein
MQNTQLSTVNINTLHFVQLIGAFDMLIVNGTIVPSNAPLIAPRTAIGVDAFGRLLIFEADGAEKDHEGLTLAQTASWFRALGAVWAINLDGGGSSTVVYPNGKLFNKPTCIDIKVECERPVTTITCVK